MAVWLRHNVRMRFLRVAIFTVAVLLSGVVPAETPYRLHALDVGEGQAILLQQGERGVLIDAGHAGMAARLVRQLESAGVLQLDYLILTHLHPDHAGGYFRVREAFPKAVVLDAYLPMAHARKPDMVRWVAEALAGDERRKRFRGGDVLRWQGLVLRALWPEGEPGPNLNRGSLVIEVVDRQRPRALLMGDAGITVEQRLLDQRRLQQDYGVLVAGHHGSSGTASEAFLVHVMPDFSVISINENNLRGYPSPEVVARLQQFSRRALLTTYRHGSVCLQWQHGEAIRRCDRGEE